MRCISCEKLSLSIICKQCQKNYFEPVFNKRELSKNFFVYSFYDYETIKDLLNSKYEFYGDKIFLILGRLSFKKFGLNFDFPSIVKAIPVDDHTRHDFSHTAILAKELKSKNIKVEFNQLKAQNKIKYAGKNLAFRKNNRRNFQYKSTNKSDVILVDDIITTGSTILEAKKTIEKSGVNVLFALTLCDAQF